MTDPMMRRMACTTRMTRIAPRSLLRSRRGDWIQMLLIFFFVLILILSITLLTIDLGKLKANREQLGVDLKNQEAAAQLIALLRHPATGGFEGGKKASIADIAIINTYDAQTKKGSYDDMLLDSISKAMPPGYYYEIDFAYPDGAVYVVTNAKFNSTWHKVLVSMGTAEGTNAGEVKDSEGDAEGKSSTYLPAAGGNIQVAFLLSRADAAVPAARAERTTRGGT